MSGLKERLVRKAIAAFEEVYSDVLHSLSVMFFAGLTDLIDHVRHDIAAGWVGWPVVGAEIGFGVAFILRTWILVYSTWRRLRAVRKK